MTDPDQLAEFPDRVHWRLGVLDSDGANGDIQADVATLAGWYVEDAAALLEDRHRLRGMLGDLDAAAVRCFWCNAPRDPGQPGIRHGDGCELAAELAPERGEVQP
jgi:hypothetical protein